MAKTVNLKPNNKVGNVSKKMNGEALVNTGTVLGAELIAHLAEWGCSTEGLIIETYAMAMAWAALKAMCKYKGYDPTELFQDIADSYEDEMIDYVEETSNMK